MVQAQLPVLLITLPNGPKGAYTKSVMSKFEVTDVNNPRVIAAVKEGMEPEFDVDAYLSEGGDFFNCDPDYLFLPDGEIIPFVEVGENLIVVPDAVELDHDAKRSLITFTESLVVAESSLYGARYSEHHVFTMDDVKGRWTDAMRQRAQDDGNFLIAYRGGQGYTYSLHDMGGPEVKVIFRKDRTKDGEVTAIFPTLKATDTLYTCYVHFGQHGGCDRGFIDRTRPASPEEYADLYKELTKQIGYNLKVVRRWPTR